MSVNQKIGLAENQKIDTFRKIIDDKLNFYENIIKKTIISIQKYKCMDIITSNELNICTQSLESLILECNDIRNIEDNDTIIKSLQNINDNIYDLLKQYGTDNLTDLLTICYGLEYINNIKNDEKFNIINKYIHPTGFKVMNIPDSKKNKQPIVKNKIVEDFMIAENAENLECFDLGRTTKNFQLKVYGIKVTLRNVKEKKIIILNGLCDDLMLCCLTDLFFKNKIKDLEINKPNEKDFDSDVFDAFLNTLSIKDLLIFNCEEIYYKFVGTINQLNLIKQKSMSQVVKDFLTSELYTQRRTIIQLLIKNNNSEFQYLAYLLYDLLSNDINGNIDTQEQTWLFDSLPWYIKKQFRIAMKQTIQYTNKLTNFDNNKIPLEQQICLLKANDSVKEKAMTKLKEVKAKSDDTGSKARQYLEGVLKIPFGIFKQEPIMSNMKYINKELNEFKNIIHKFLNKDISNKVNYYNFKDELSENTINTLNEKIIEKINQLLINKKRPELIKMVIYINNIIKIEKMNCNKICYSGKKQQYLRTHIMLFINKNKNNLSLISEFIKTNNIEINEISYISQIQNKLSTIKDKNKEISVYMNKSKDILESAIHGHSSAKRQIERIIGQWISGDLDGYCFGFEGPPGVGKTSLAKKGIANCLTDENNEPRPFSFIAVGGSSNGSTFEGHNYTYVGSTWGKIVDVIIESKCMNPIIFIDELDKISKTEHGKEIIGILTHLIDPAQNNTFQDRYFSGIDLDLSKALFIFSYNDANIIDKILLDRIHRIKFKHLTIDEKIIITNNYILPELYKKMGLEDTLIIKDEVIKFIIQEYTYEAGVRNLKQHLFDIIGEINLKLLNDNFNEKIPFIVTIEDVKNKYLKDKHPVKPTLIHKSPSIGIINGLWANSSGKGGIIQIETKFFASNSLLDLKLTGSQGDVMKESMNVSKTLAWNLTDKKIKKNVIKSFEETKNQGLHIHCPEGAVPKDGPSAGTAITIAIYSLLTNKKIKNDFAITGEITLQGKVGEIGGLDLKILGGISGGVKSFIYPKDNTKDFNEFMDKNKDKDFIKNINFYPVENIEEVIELIFV